MRDRIIWILIMITILGLMVDLSLYDNYLMQKQMTAQVKGTVDEAENSEGLNGLKTGNEEKINQSEGYLLLAVGDQGNLAEGGETPIYTKAQEDAEIISVLQYNCAVLIRKEYLNNSTNYKWIPVDLPNKNRIGYVDSEQVEIESLRIKDSTDSDVRNQIIEDAVSFIGLKFVRYGKSLKKGIDCSNFIQQIYGRAGINIDNTPNGIKKEAQIISEEDALPGDIVYYDVNDGEGHVGIYLGNGFMINSAGHDGRRYPKGGVRICRLLYHDRDSYEFCKIIQ